MSEAVEKPVVPNHDPIGVLVNELDRRDRHIRRQNGWIAALFLLCAASSGGIASLVVSNHTQVEKQLTAQKNAPAQIAAVEKAVLCPELEADNSNHSTPLRVALIAKYCSPSKEETP